METQPLKKPTVVIFDLDGTLTESKQVLRHDMALLLQQLLNIVPVAVMSGGDLPQFEHQFLSHMPKESNFSNLFLFPTSAAECLVYDNGSWKDGYDYIFSPHEKEKIISAMKHVIQSTGITKGEILYGEQIEDRGEQITFSALGQDVPLDVKTTWDPDQKKRHHFAEELQKLLPEFGIRIGGLTSVDVTRKGISKETGVHWLAKRFGVSAETMLYIGDALYPGGNDTAVIPTGIEIRQVAGPKETGQLIHTLLT